MSADADMDFAASVKKQREAHKMSQAELADATAKYGLSFQATTIHKIEKGTRRVTVGEAVAIAHALRVSLHELLGQGVDSAYIAKEYLLDAGMEILFAHERVMDSLRIMVTRQHDVKVFLADYRDRFGEDPVWLAYKAGSQDLRAHWEPLATWDGPDNYMDSWRELLERSGQTYLSDLGWADDRVGPRTDG